MPDPLIDAINEFQMPPQMINVDRDVAGEIGQEIVIPVRFVIHKKSEMGNTVLRVVEVMGDGSVQGPSSPAPTIQINPSPSA